MNYRKSIELLPFDGGDLTEAQKIFYNFSDDALDELTEVSHDRASSNIDAGNGNQLFSLIELLSPNGLRKLKFAKTWRLAEKYLW